MNVLICGDSFSANWQVKYPEQQGWPNLLAKHHRVTNIAQAAVSEYKILQQIKSVDLSTFDAVIISHASPNRIHCGQHPVHANDPLHKDSDLIYRDLEGRTDADSKLACDYFERYFELEYYSEVAQLLCMDILNRLGEYPELNQLHLVNYHKNNPYDFLPSYNINSVFSKHAGLMNHFDDIGNKQVFDKVNGWLQSVNQV